MADNEIIRIKVSAMPLATTLEGLITYGIVGGIAYKVPVTLLKGNTGNPGATIELTTDSTYIKWRVVGASTWTNLITVASLVGATGPAVELSVQSGNIAWRQVGGTTWTNIVALTSLVGPTGPQGNGLTIKDRYDTFSALQAAITSPVAGDAYAVGTVQPYNIYIYGTVSGWVNHGPLAGADGDSAYIYIAFASDSSGTGFTLTDSASLHYMAVKHTTTPIASPAASDFTGLWFQRSPDGNLTITFSQAETKANIASGESLATMFGKLMKWYSSFGALAWVNRDPFESGYNTVTTIASLPVDKRLIVCNIAASGTLSLASNDIINSGKELFIKVRNSGTSKTITLPNTGDFESKKTDGTAITSVTVPASGSIEISIICADKYLIVTNG